MIAKIAAKVRRVISYRAQTNFDGDTYNLDNRPVESGLFTPQIIYRNGACYFVVQTIEGSDMLAIVGKQDGDNVSITETGIGPISDSDYHNKACIDLDADGYVYVIMNQHGGKSRIIKSAEPYSIASFSATGENVGDSGSFTTLGYCSLQKSTAGTYHYITRRTGQPYRIVLFNASSGLNTWGGGVAVTENPTTAEGKEDNRHYPVMPYNALSDGWNYQCITKRFDNTASYTHYKHWFLKTQDFQTWYNIDGTFSKNITSAALTEAELNANCLGFTMPEIENYSENPFVEVYNSEVYGVTVDRTLVKFYRYNSAGGWNYDEIDFTQIPNFWNHEASFRGFVHIRPNRILMWCNVYEDGIYKVKAFYTNDKFEFFNEAYTMFDDAEGTQQVKFPNNFNEIPTGQKFAIIGSGFKNAATGPSDANNNDLRVLIAVK